MIETWLPPLPEAVARARETAAGRLPEHVSKACSQDVRLLVSEAMTEIVAHASPERRPTICMAISATPTEIRATVEDLGPARAQGSAMWGAGEGSDLSVRIVDRLADRWGVMRGFPPGIWFEIDLPRPSPAASRC